MSAIFTRTVRLHGLSLVILHLHHWPQITFLLPIPLLPTNVHVFKTIERNLVYPPLKFTQASTHFLSYLSPNTNCLLVHMRTYLLSSTFLSRSKNWITCTNSLQCGDVHWFFTTLKKLLQFISTYYRRCSSIVSDGTTILTCVQSLSHRLTIYVLWAFIWHGSCFTS